MIFGFSEDMLKKLGATFTVTEIRQQPKLWRETYNIVKQNKNKIEEFLNKNLKSNTRIILTGAGTSDYVGDSLYLHLAKTLNLRVEAIATTDLVSNPHEFVEEDTKTILVSYARSGNSPESIGAYDIFKDNVKDIAQLVITCNEEGQLARKSLDDENTLCLLMTKESNDKSFAMTSSFSCMLLATLLTFDIKNLEQNKKYVDIISDKADFILDNDWKEIIELVELGCERVVYLGSGALKGLCQEMALKNLELTSGKTVTVCESVLGFRHGPKSIINDNTLVIFMNSINEYTNLYDMDLIKEIHGDVGNHKLAVISYKKNDELNSLCDKYIEINGEDVPEIYTLFNYMLFGQMFGLFSSLHLGISPDNPRPDGTVNRVVKGVIIHPYNK
ncbi:tagatose-6-phosphate ketose isomerase [Clostridium baratii]|uniref:SIS domain-containing protein n=1 Tax=Clostridium baratii TaxID=1561 RepID=UPI0009A4506C|nr:SIS domain-containing protein [Clostridium baratii]OPF52806.1 tagatose-6-phosphate ketose isomerase [Clostridium baratii]OPF56255.1 tagatose-6-phosphate ketose isomerase [Clostridium baratii]OPF58150.1 tagatose-6-phosphate ketose isomerase [Clostridium baratii]OPF59363.1 tagatose-6-phosphate ketose isomerase [Clostridium baratii]